MLEPYRRQFPNAANAEDVTRKLAVAYAETNRPADAAVEFEHISSNATEEPAVRREALSRAADLYGKAGNDPKTLPCCERLVAEYPTPVPEAIEVRERLAQLAAKSGDTAANSSGCGKSSMPMRRPVRRAPSAPGISRRTPSLKLAEPLRDSFRAIHLVAPLKKSLVAKRQSMEAALAAYKAAAEYHVAGSDHRRHL